jgi:hypothetical protein
MHHFSPDYPEIYDSPVFITVALCTGLAAETNQVFELLPGHLQEQQTLNPMYLERTTSLCFIFCVVIRTSTLFH